MASIAADPLPEGDIVRRTAFADKAAGFFTIK